MATGVSGSVMCLNCGHLNDVNCSFKDTDYDSSTNTITGGIESVMVKCEKCGKRLNLGELI